MSDAKKVAAAAAVAAASVDPTEVVKKRKRAPPQPSTQPKPKAAPREPYGAWICTDHPTLPSGRLGIAISARTESEAHDRVVAELERRGLSVEKVALRSLAEGEVFMFQ